MSFPPVIIRPAQERDMKSIWHLLHADGKPWSHEMICNELPNLFVLTYQERIISIFKGVFITGGIEEFWIVTHPFYLNHSIKVAMENIMESILNYKILNDIVKSSTT